MKYLTNLDLNKNELQNAVVQNLSSAPSNPKAGQHYFNTTDHKEYVYDGTNWVDALSQGNYTFQNGVKETNRTVELNLASGANVGNVTLTASSNGLAASVAEASTSAKGIIEIATDLEAATGTSEVLAVNPKQLATKVTANDAITGATKTKITYDAKGLVTSGADLEASDIPVLDSAKVTTLGSYTKASSSAAIATTDSLNAALGKLEYKADAAVVANTAITAGTHTKITYDSKGLVTAGADLAESDIPSLHLSKVTDVTATATEVNVLDGIEATTAELNILHGVTADASELNILDGATLTTAELNYVDGVTSSIQTQLDDKVAKNDAITAGTKCKITYDAKGLVTAGADLVASDIPDISATYVAVTEKGAASGVAELDANGKVPSSQLPSYVDDVVDLLAIATTAPATCAAGDMYYNSSDKKIFTATSTDTWSETGVDPEKGKIYVNLANDGCYRWSGSEMINITNPIGAATTSTPGIVELATDEEATTGTDAQRAVTPHALKAAMAGATVTFTNKTFDANGTGNSLSNVEVADFASGVVVTSIAAVSSASDSKLASEKAAATALAGKQDLVTSATADNIATLTAAGQAQDSGKAFVTSVGPAEGTSAATHAQIATAAATRAAIDAAAGAAAHKEVKPFDADDATFANGQVTWTFANPFSDADVMVQIKQSDNEVVIADVDTDSSTITITFNADAKPADNAYKAVMIG